MIKIPKKIFNILNEPRRFDYLFLEKLKKHERGEDAYYEVIEDIRKYAPKYKHNFTSFHSYRTKLHFNTTGHEDVPKEIIDVITGGFDELVDYYYKIHYNRKKAYETSLKKVNKHFPKWKPYKNYMSYINSKSYKHKIKKVAKKAKQG